VLGYQFNETVKNVFNSYNNKNYFLTRCKPYNPNGRFQTEEESDLMSEQLKRFLTKNDVNFEVRPGSKEAYDGIVDSIILELAKDKWNNKDN